MHLAELCHGEIISVDSMQVYRGLDLGTAKPCAEERRRVKHHLIDVVDLTENFDAAQFIERAHQAAQEIRSRGNLPILCGGTGLYFKAFLEGLGSAPPSDPGLRAELEARPLPELLKELAGLDPVTFEGIDRNNPRRVVRALEVCRLTGKPFSEQRGVWEAGEAEPASAHRFFVLTRSPADLKRRIDERVDWMFERGLVSETEKLLRAGLEGNKTAMQALGYRQVIEHLRGERALEATVELVKIRTRQFAKRQLTWFRRHAKATWISVGERDSARELAEKMAFVRPKT